MTTAAARLVSALCALVALCACTGRAAPEPGARRTPAVVPTAAAPTASPSPTPAPDEIDIELSEQLLLSAGAKLTVTVGGRRSVLDLRQSPLLDSVLEQTENETKRVLRLQTAGAARPAESLFSLEGVAAPGSFKTGEAGLKVIIFDERSGIDLLSDDGSCVIVFAAADANGARGTINCRNTGSRTRRISVTGTFAATRA